MDAAVVRRGAERHSGTLQTGLVLRLLSGDQGQVDARAPNQ
jgi:hypothetical protein